MDQSHFVMLWNVGIEGNGDLFCEINRILLQKMEELTLHLIEKDVRSLKKDVILMKKEMLKKKVNKNKNR